MLIGVITKQPREVKDRDIDFSNFLADRPGDHLVNATVSVSDSSLEAFFDPAETTYAKLWVTGGVHTMNYLVTIIGRTYMGRIEEHEIRVFVRDWE